VHKFLISTRLTRSLSFPFTWLS